VYIRLVAKCFYLVPKTAHLMVSSHIRCHVVE
jgi:hypothetical protein